MAAYSYSNEFPYVYISIYIDIDIYRYKFCASREPQIIQRGNSDPSKTKYDIYSLSMDISYWAFDNYVTIHIPTEVRYRVR